MIFKRIINEKRVNELLKILKKENFTFDWYDGPLSGVVGDAKVLHHFYIVNQSLSGYCYLHTPITFDTLKKYILGKLDSLSIIKSYDYSYLYSCRRLGKSKIFKVKTEDLKKQSKRYLPVPGYSQTYSFTGLINYHNLKSLKLSEVTEFPFKQIYIENWHTLLPEKRLYERYVLINREKKEIYILDRHMIKVFKIEGDLSSFVYDYALEIYDARESFPVEVLLTSSSEAIRSFIKRFI